MKRHERDGSNKGRRKPSRASISLLGVPDSARRPAPQPGARAGVPLHLELAKKLGGLPPDLGVALMGLGLVGMVIPGPIPPGASFVLLGAAILSPGLAARFGGCLEGRLVGLLRLLIDFVDRLRTDLRKRYPGSVQA
jgi:hypothetical protein